MLGGHARSRQSDEEKALHENSEGRQDGNYLHVPTSSLPAVIKVYATLRDAKLTESSYDKVVMWTGGSHDYDVVMRALVRLDCPEMRPGTRGQNGKTAPVYFTDPEANAPTPALGSEVHIQPSIDRPHWNEVLDALQEDVDFCEDGETTIARDGAIAIPVFSTLLTMVRRRPRKRTKCQRYYCRFSLPTSWISGPSERSSTRHRRLEVSWVPDVVQAAESRDRV